MAREHEKAAQNQGSSPSLFLVNPALKYKHFVAQREMSRLLGKRAFSVPLALPLLAALTPGHYRIRIIDEEMDDLPQDEKPDIVGITTLVSTIRRACEIADRYRAEGVKVVMGGTYATYMKDEVLEHADSVVLGEAEDVWASVLADFEKGDLKPLYQAERVTPFKESPVPRWDLVDTKDIMLHSVQVSRGCPYRCEFCLVSKMFGRRLRYRNLDNVLAEIDALPLKKIFFADDNITADKVYARRLAGALKGRGLSWVCQASLDVADEEELLDAMAEAGCATILIGFESVDPACLKETRKHQNKVSDYDKVIARIHERGMNVAASFIVGFDADGPEAFDRINEFSIKNNLWFTMLSPLTAAPGTDLYDRMKAEGRLLDVETDLLNGVFPSIRYNRMSAVEMFDRFFEAVEKLMDYGDARAKAMGLFRSGRFTRPEGGGITFREKLSTSMKLLRGFLMSGDPEKRRLFQDLFKLVRRKRLTPDKAVVFMLQMAGYHDWWADFQTYREDVREKIQRVDPGPLRRD
jgi:radical SAM superfamily enzyme YgiQ (UPF0313 family)